MTKKLTKTDLEQVVNEQHEQLTMMEKMLLNRNDRNSELHIALIEEQAKKRPVLDANLWLGLKIGWTIGFGVTAIIATFIIIVLL